MINEKYNDSVLVCSTLRDIAPEALPDYVLHYLCLTGTCTFAYWMREHTAQAGDCIIISLPLLLEQFQPSEDYTCRLIAVKRPFMESSRPRSNYGNKGVLALFENPVMRLTEEESYRCNWDMDAIQCTCAHPEHRFQDEMVSIACQRLFLDFFDFHLRIYGEDMIPLQSASLLSRFLSLLEDGNYRQHRDISWYADQLCVTAKHLSETCKRVSGFNASYWINRFTTIDLKRCLQDKILSLTQIQDDFNFSSAAYLTRFTRNNLGKTPSEFRE